MADLDFTQSLRSVSRNVSRTTLNIIFLLDVSGSMAGDGKINSLNNTMRELPLTLKREADDKKLQLLIRAISFGSSAKYVLGSKEKGAAIDDGFVWQDIETELKTATASAISLAAEALEPQYLGKKNNTPIIFLITDGLNTESDAAYDSAVKEINSKLGGKAIRVCIAIGNDYSTDDFKKFATFGPKPNSAKICQEHYIYTVHQNDDIAKIITDISSLMILKSESMGHIL